MKATRAATALVAAAIVVSIAAIPSEASDDVAAFYKGKTISATIGYPPGGGYDIYMRALARHIGRHIPGNPIVVPRNMPGAGSLVAANHIYNTAAKDGTVIGIFASSTLFSVKLGETKGNFEIDKFTWIGNMDQTIGTCVVHKRANIASFQDLFARKRRSLGLPALRPSTAFMCAGSTRCSGRAFRSSMAIQVRPTCCWR